MDDTEIIKIRTKLKRERDAWAWSKFVLVFGIVIAFLFLVVTGFIVLYICEKEVPHHKLPRLSELTNKAKHKRELSDDENDRISTKTRIANLRKRLNSKYK